MDSTLSAGRLEPSAHTAPASLPNRVLNHSVILPFHLPGVVGYVPMPAVLFLWNPLLFWPLSPLSFPIKALENDLLEKLQYLKVLLILCSLGNEFLLVYVMGMHDW